MKKHIITLIAAAVLIASGGSYAANLAFAFNVPLDTVSCLDLPGCSSPPDSAVIFVELAIDKPRVPDQQWGTSDVISYAVSGFPTMNDISTTLINATFEGTYTVDGQSGVAVATLENYYIGADNYPAGDYNVLDPIVWYYQEGERVDGPSTGSIQAFPSAPDAAYAQLAPVPVPAAAYLFITALAGLFGAKRVARRQQVSV